MLSQIYASIGSFLPQPMKQRSLNYQNLLQLLWKSFLCRLFFQMIEINYVPIYMKINHIFFVIKGQFPVTDYIPNTIILYFIVHCIYVLRIFYGIACLCLSLTPPVSGLRCIVFNKVLFCSVLFCRAIWAFVGGRTKHRKCTRYRKIDTNTARLFILIPQDC